LIFVNPREAQRENLRRQYKKETMVLFSGASKFNVEVIERQTNAFIEECLDNPQGQAADVMANLKR
jgi:hypothetical protein